MLCTCLALSDARIGLALDLAFKHACCQRSSDRKSVILADTGNHT